MSCLPQFTYSIYADGELPAEEARAVEAHLGACSACRALLEALREENRLLTAALAEPEATVTVPATRPRDVLWTALAVLAAAVGLQTVWDWVGGASASTGAEWLSPFSLSGQLNIFFSTFFYFVQEGAAMLASSFAMVSALVVGLVLVGAAALLLRRRPATLVALVTVAMALGLALPTSALDKRKGETITIGSAETIDDTLLVKGATVNVDGVVNGDLIVFAQKLSLRGTVKGSVMAFAQSMEINGTVEGNLYTFAQWLQMGGQAKHNLYAFCQNCVLNSSGSVGTDVILFGQNQDFDGTIGRDATVSGESTEVRGAIGRHLTATAHRIRLVAPARVGGNLTAHVQDQKDLQVDAGVTVGGKTETRAAKRRVARGNRYAQGKFYFGQALRLLAALVTGLLLFWLFPALFPARVESGSGVLIRLGMGFLALVATPIAAIIVGITLIGLPVAILGLMTWVAGLYFAKVFVGALLGQALLRSPAQQLSSKAMALLVGLVLIYVGTNLPYLGGWITFLMLLFGLGIGFQQVRAHWQRPQAQLAA